MPAEAFCGQFEIFEVEGDYRFVVGAADQGVGVVDVDLGLDEGVECLFESCFRIDFDHEQVRLGKSEVIFHQDFAGLIRVVDYDAYDGAVGGIEDGEGEDVDIPRVEQADEVVEAAEAVGGEDGELAYRFGRGGLGGDGRHDGCMRFGRIGIAGPDLRG